MPRKTNFQRTMWNHGFDSIDQYFDYIADSYLDGQYTQGDKLFQDLSNDKRALCLEYLAQKDAAEAAKIAIRYFTKQS